MSAVRRVLILKKRCISRLRYALRQRFQGLPEIVLISRELLQGFYRRLPIRYPFPEGGDLGPPELLEAWLDDGGSKVPLKIDTAGSDWVWTLPPPKGPSLVVHVRYRQRMLDRNARYVLVSTRKWGRPLQSAVLEVRMEDSRECRIAPSLLEVESEGDRRVFRKEFRSWLPDRDLLVELVQ